MNPSTPRPHRPEPLTPEERALAARLARVGPHGEPPPSLDAAIIGAAHAAAGQRAPRHRRWPALLGVAATLALAVGVSWQMRPTADAPVAGDEFPREAAPMAAVAPAADSQAAAASDIEAALPGKPQPARAPVAAQQQRREPAAVAVPEPPAAKMQAPPPPPPAPRVLPAAPPNAPAPPAAPMQPAAPAPEADAAVRSQRDATSQRMQDSSARSGTARRSSENAATAAAAPAAFPTAVADLPVAQDRQLEPAAWLERIRLRRDAGDIAGARESLQLLRREHPHVVLPDDLRRFADGEP